MPTRSPGRTPSATKPVAQAIGQRVELAVADRCRARLDDRDALGVAPCGLVRSDSCNASGAAHGGRLRVLRRDRACAMSAIVSRCSRSTSWASSVIAERSSRNSTSFSVAMESRMPPGDQRRASVSSSGSSPGRNSLMMKSLMYLLDRVGHRRDLRIRKQSRSTVGSRPCCARSEDRVALACSSCVEPLGDQTGARARWDARPIRRGGSRRGLAPVDVAEVRRR